METTRRCTKHNNGEGADLPLDTFYNGRYHSWCKECHKASRRRRYASGQAIPTLKDRYNNMRWQANKRGLTFDLTFKQWQDIISQSCAYGLSGPEIRIGIDRKDNILGYTLTNSLPCCARHNEIKSDVFTYEQLIDICARYPDVARCGNSRAGRKRKV